MKKILSLLMLALLSVGAWATNNLTLDVSETVAFGEWGFDNSEAPTINLGNWAAGGGWVFDTPLSQDDYCGVAFTMEATTEHHVTLFIVYDDDTDQSVDVPAGSTSVAADFSGDGAITKIGFKYGDWEDTANENGATITITSAVVKTYGDKTLSASETVAFGDWGFDNSAAPTLKFSNWAAGGGWKFATALSQTHYCGVDFTMEPTVGDHVTFTITYEGGETQNIDVPAGTTSVKADFAFTGGVTKIGFSHGDWEGGVDPAVITITSAVVKAHSAGTVSQLAFADLSEPGEGSEGYTKDAATQTITIGKYTWASYWSFAPAILSDDYEKIVITFAEAVPESGLTINAEVVEDASWCGSTLGTITKGATKATAYFSALPGASITRIGFFLDWQAESATLKIASVKLVKKPQTEIPLTVTITDAGYATYVTTAATDFSLTYGITAYIAKVNDSWVELTEVTKVPAGTGVILKGAAASYTLQPTTESTNNVTDNDLLVSDGTVAANQSTIYVLADGNKGVGFYLLNNGYVHAGKAYLKVPANANARQFIGFGDDTTTGISQIENRKLDTEDGVFNLSGQRVVSPTKGLFVVNGKKVVITK